MDCSGQFNLDPNRVIDLILDCFESCLPHRTLYLRILRKFNVSREELCNLLALKFLFHQRSEQLTPMDLYRVASILCQENMLDMLQLFRMLAPKTTDLVNEHKELVALVKKRCTKAEIILTSQLAAQSMNDATVAMQTAGNDMLSESF